MSVEPAADPGRPGPEFESAEADDAGPGKAMPPADDPGTPFRPVAEADRVGPVDTLRGVALLGILTMNIIAFAWPFSAYTNPMIGGGFDGPNRALWWLNQLVFSGKMMTLFSMLFGAGLALMSVRADKASRRLGPIYYRRILWLLAFGLVHAYFLWWGDILVPYAICGLFLFPLRNLSPRALIPLGVALVCVPLVFLSLAGVGVSYVQGAADRARDAESAGRPVDPDDQRMLDVVRQMEEGIGGSREAVDEEIAVYRGRDYLAILGHRAPVVLAFQAVGIPLMFFWSIGGRMVLGIGLMKLGVFAAARSWRFYGAMAVLGYGIGLPLVAWGSWRSQSTGFDALAGLAFPGPKVVNELGTIPVALGHAAVVMLVCKAGLLTWLTRRLAAVGRMALTNYLMHTILCTTFFYGYGLGYFARFDRQRLWLVVLAIWAFQLIVSPWWLARFRYGPAEWLWRTLTYWKVQPIRRAGPIVTAA